MGRSQSLGEWCIALCFDLFLLYSPFYIQAGVTVRQHVLNIVLRITRVSPETAFPAHRLELLQRSFGIITDIRSDQG